MVCWVRKRIRLSPELVADIRKFTKEYLKDTCDELSDKEVVDVFVALCDTMAPVMEMMRNFTNTYKEMMGVAYTEGNWVHPLHELHERILEETLLGDVRDPNRQD